ncbi:MAG: helix-turn-helix transcriptional regulator [Clostridia bacterium]|nr:helix-turn-helix transcriptional regulator [Clostridia bacterium]
MLKERNLSIYQCAKMGNIPYTTLSELVRGKTQIGKCSADTVYKLSRILHVSMEKLMADAAEPRYDFEIFKSNVCHKVKDIGDLDFIITTLENDDVRKYWVREWYAEAFYLLAMIDYLSRINDIPLCMQYDDIRSHSLGKTIYPRDVLLTCRLMNDDTIKETCMKEAIPEFLQFNIVESEIRDVY